MRQLKINDLDLNDRTNYWLAPKGFVPKPGAFRQKFAESPNRNGKELRTARQTVDCDVLSFRIRVQGASPSDLKAKLDPILVEIQKPESLISWIQEGDTVKYWTAIQAPTVDPSTYFDCNWIDIGVCEISWEMEAQPRPYRARETLKVLENLVPNGNVEEWSSGNTILDGWTFVTSGDSEITRETDPTYIRYGKSAVKMTRDATEDDCYMITDDFISIDALLYYFTDSFFSTDYTTGQIMKHAIMCFNASGDPTGSIVMSSTNGLSAPREMILFDYLYGGLGDWGVISPGDFPANTTKVKLKLELEGTGTKYGYWDCIQFRCARYLPTHKALNPIAINIPPADLKGTAPAEMDLVLKSLWHKPWAYLIGQKRLPHMEGNSVKEITELDMGGQDPMCLEGNFRVYPVSPNKVTNGNMSSSSGSGNTTDWNNWTESRSGNTGVIMQASSQSCDAGNGSVEVTCNNALNKCPNPGFEEGDSTTPDDWTKSNDGDVDGYRVKSISDYYIHSHSGSYMGGFFAGPSAAVTDFAEYTLTDYLSVDVIEKYYLEVYLLSNRHDAATTMYAQLYLKCYDASSSSTGTVMVYQGNPYHSTLTTYLKYGGYINPSAWPAGTTKCKICLEATVYSTAQRGNSIYFDDFKFFQVSYNFNEQLESDFIAIDDEKDYMVSWATKAGFAASRVVPSYLHADFYDATPTLLESRELWCVNPGTSWEMHRKIFDATELPEGVTQAKLRAVRLGSAEVSSINLIPSHLWDSFNIREEPILAEAEFDIDPHVGRYLLAANITIEDAGDPIDGTLTVYASIVDALLGDITEMVEVGTIDIGNPQEKWVNTGLLEECLMIDIPTPDIPDGADLANLSMKVRLNASYDFNTDLNYYIDFMGLIPVCQAIAKITGLTDEQNLILNCTSHKRSLLTSLDGSLNMATKSKATCISNFNLLVHPKEGVSLVILALYNNSGSFDVRPVYDVEIQYNPKDYM